MHWPYPPNPAEYQSGLGLLIAVFAIASVCMVVVFYAVQSSGPLLHEPEPEMDETTSAENDRKKTTE